MDVRFILFCQWLFLNPGAGGTVAAHVLARNFRPGVVDGSGTFQPAIVVCDGAQTSRPGYTATGAAQAWATAPPTLAAQALVGQNFDWLNVSILNFGPPATQAEVAAALAASGL